MARARILALLLAAVVGAACSESPSAPSTSTTLTFFAEPPFVGTLAVAGSASKDFVVSLTGPVTVTLGSLLSAGNPVALTVGIGLGDWDSATSTCTVTTQTTGAPALTAIPSFSPSLTAGSRCVTISDVGNLTGPVNFAVRVTHP